MWHSPKLWCRHGDYFLVICTPAWKEASFPPIDVKGGAWVSQSLRHWQPLWTNSFLSFETLYLTSIKTQYFIMPHLSQMTIKLRKLAFFMLMDQAPDECPASKYTYYCRLCRVTSEVKYQMYFHLETAHSTGQVIEFFCDLPPRVAKDDFIKFLCGDRETLDSMTLWLLCNWAQ